jgi:branched-chain amino acid transport system ATP-binding protein
VSSPLVVDGVRKTFGGLVALDGVSLEVPPGGHVIGLIGPNGAGKTTLFNCITGYLRPDQGDVRLGRESITSLKPHQRARQGVGRTFQRLAVFDTMTVEDNIHVAVEARSLAKVIRGLFTLRHPIEDHVRRRTDEIIALMRLEDVRTEPAGVLPTGTQRLVELGRALAIQPAFVLLDEPASGLDSGETGFLERVLHDTRASGVSLLLVEHDVDLVLRLCEQVHVLDFGRPIAAGTPAEIARDPRVRAAYLGDETVEVSASATGA